MREKVKELTSEVTKKIVRFLRRLTNFLMFFVRISMNSGCV